MATQADQTTAQANEQLFLAVESMLDVIKDLSRNPMVDFSEPHFGKLAEAHADLRDAADAARR